MRFAQRGGSVNPTSDQQVEHFEGDSAAEVTAKISEMVDKFAIRIATVTGWVEPSVGILERYHALVVFEEEPQKPAGW